jgi:hypothetical protein
VLDTAIQIDPSTGQASVQLGLLTALVAGMVAIPIVTGVIAVWETLLSNPVGGRCDPRCSPAPSTTRPPGAQS